MMTIMQQDFSTIVYKKLLESGFSSTKPDLMPVGGGSINRCFKVMSGSSLFFLKVNEASRFPGLFQKEAEGLNTLTTAGVFRIPQVHAVFESAEHQFLLMEWIEPGVKNSSFWIDFGEKLAKLHSIHAREYGAAGNNYMGSIEQINDPKKNWITFFWECRLQPLISKCYNHQLLHKAHLQKFRMLEKKLEQVFADAQSPVLLHGDLWTGNFLCDQHSAPVLIDPAVYYGHPSVDLGMTTLFGGFHSHFYEAYTHYKTLPLNYVEQWRLANLYPLLIHLLLFGSSYLSEIDATLELFA